MDEPTVQARPYWPQRQEFTVLVGYTALALVAAGIASVAGLGPAQGTLRVSFGVLLLFVVPGYAATLAFYPKTEDITRLERLALSLGLSIAVVLFAALIGNHVFGVPLTAEGIAFMVAAAVVLLLGIRTANDLLSKK